MKSALFKVFLYRKHCLLGKKQKDQLSRVIGLKNGTPIADSIHCELAMIDDKQLEKAFFSWTHGMFKANPPKKDEIEVVALDGKTIRRSNTAKGKKNAHIVSAWADRLEIALAQVKVDEKSNEITAVPELLELMDLKGVIVTIDAMGCQKRIVEKITEKNQTILFFLKGISRLCTKLDWLARKDEWANLEGVGIVKNMRITSGIKTTDVRYFICYNAFALITSAP